MELAPGIHQLNIPMPDSPLDHLNCYLIEGKNGWLMLDTGWRTPLAFEAMMNGLRGAGLSPEDIATVVVTHVHPDHFGLAGKIKQISPETELLTHHWESALIESRYVKFAELRDRMGSLLRRHGVPAESSLESASIPVLEFVDVTFPDRVIYGGEVLSTGVYDLEVIWTPGHSPGHICIYEPKNRILFSGDHVLPSITPNVSYHVQSGDNPLGDYLYSLHKLRNLDVDKVLPAHQDTFGNLEGRIEKIFDHHKRRRNKIQEILGGQSRNAYEIAAEMKWGSRLSWDQLPVLHKRSAVLEILSHLEWMRRNGRVERIIEGDSVSYCLSSKVQ